MKVLMLGDSPLVKTGFGRVNAHALKAFLAQGWEVASVTGLQTKRDEPQTDLPLKLYVPDDNDLMGLKVVPGAYEEFQPDVVYGTGDPGNVSTFTLVLPDTARYIAYVPIEGEPIVHEGWRRILSYIDFFTCSKYGTEVAKSSLHRDVDFVYHGVDRDVFTPLSDEERTTYRKRLGWENKFVIVCVAQNVKRKQLTRLIEAVAILKKHFHQNDIILYLHTVPYQGHYLDGWNLTEIAEAYGVYHEVVFNPLMGKRGSAIPERGDLEVPGLRELMGSGDLFALFSQVEGFGLPIAEAMACGLPVVVTKYAAGWEVANLGGGTGVPPRDWEVHKSGTRYGNVDPMDAAKEILRLKRNPRLLARMRQQGLKAVEQFDWALFEAEVVKRVIDASKKSPETEVQPDAVHSVDPAPEEGAPQDHLREDTRQVGSGAGEADLG